MSIFPITPLVRQVQHLILETFDISEQQAEDYAAEMVSLAEGWGSPEIAGTMDWNYRIRKSLGEARKLPWRSQASVRSLKRHKMKSIERMMRLFVPNIVPKNPALQYA